MVEAKDLPALPVVERASSSCLLLYYLRVTLTQAAVSCHRRRGFLVYCGDVVDSSGTVAADGIVANLAHDEKLDDGQHDVEDVNDGVWVTDILVLDVNSVALQSVVGMDEDDDDYVDDVVLPNEERVHDMVPCPEEGAVVVASHDMAAS
jgi:hypothetical protein